MNAVDELRKLTGLFPEPEPLFANVEHIPSSLTPEPYKTMLVHDHHMTLAMEEHFGRPVNVRILDQRFDGDLYVRKIQLALDRSDRIVLFGWVRFDFQYVTAEVKAEILAGKTPLGRVLIEHNVLRHIDLAAILQLQAGPGLAHQLGMPEGATTYGRLATIFCNRRPAVDLLEISTPLD